MSDTHEIESTVSTQVLSEDDQQLRDEAYSRLRIWADGCREFHDRAREARKIMLMQDPRQDEGRPGKERTIQVQTLHSTITNCVADQMDNMPEARMLPERPDLQQVAEDMTDVVQYVLRLNDYENKHRQMAEDLFVAGTVVVQVVWDDDMDNGEGNIAIIRWPVESFLWDPKAASMQDGRAVMKISWHPISWYRSHYPETGIYVGADDRQHGDIGKPDAMSDELSGDEPMAMLMEYWWREYDAKNRRYKVNVAYFAGGALLDKAMNVYDHGRYPFDMAVYDRIEGSPAGEGLVMELAPMMRYINRYARYIDENARMSAKIRMMVRKNANIDQEALADWNENLIAGDSIGEDAVRWLQSKPLNNTVMNQMLQFQTDIKQDSGQNQFTRGETAGGVTAASAISALQEAGGKITRLHTQELNQAFARIAEMIAWLISQFYTGKKTRMVTGRDGQQREVNMSAAHLMGEEKGKGKSKGPLPAPPYTVQIQVQRRNPLRVQAQNELILQAYQMSVQNGIPFKLTDLFALLNVDGKDRIIPQLAIAEAQADQMAQLAQQAQQLQAENDALRKTVQSYSQSMAAAGEANIDDTGAGLPVDTGMQPGQMI